jgi:hypothetical protein
MQRPQPDGGHWSGRRRVVEKGDHGAYCHAPHVSSDHPDHEDLDHGRGRKKDVGRTVGADTADVGIAVDGVGTARAADRAATGDGSHDANGVYRPWVGPH